MKNKILFTLILVALLVGLTACSSDSTPKMTAVIDQAAGSELDQIQKGLNELNSSSNVLSAAQVDDSETGPCVLYQRYEKYAALQKQYLGTTADEHKQFPKLGTDLDTAVQDTARRTTNAAYERMQAGKQIGFGCGQSDVDSVRKIAAMMDKYGAPEGTDPKVIRAAYLRAVRPEVQEALAAVKNHGNSDTEGWLLSLAEDAKTNWHFTASDIGIPTALIKKYDL